LAQKGFELAHRMAGQRPGRVQRNSAVCELAEVQVAVCDGAAQQLPEQGPGLRLLWRKTWGQGGLLHEMPLFVGFGQPITKASSDPAAGRLALQRKRELRLSLDRRGEAGKRQAEQPDRLR